MQRGRALFPVFLAEFDFQALELRHFLFHGPHECVVLVAAI